MMESVLSYRHAYHAGNHADVLKHLVLISCLEHMNKKETPYRYVDTHAGAGGFDLSTGFSAEHEEWKDGTERLRSFVAASAAEEPPRPISDYLRLVDAFRKVEGAASYPGSPAIAATFLRQADRAILFELHPRDHGALAARFSGDTCVQVRKADGLTGLRSVLPPPSRRALVLIDPSYEVKAEYDLVIDAVSASLRRFSTGVYLVWYPILERVAALSLPDRLLALHEGARCRAELRVKLPREDGRGMSGSGIVVLNPPWTLQAVLQECMPYLARALGDEGAAAWKLSWQEGVQPRVATRIGDAVSKK